MRYRIKYFFNLLPLSTKNNIRHLWEEYHWRSFLLKRTIIEYFQRYRTWNIDLKRNRPYVIYMTGMPRTGSSFMKNYLADFEGIKIMPFKRSGFFISWEQSIAENEFVFVDKSTHYIRHLNKIIAACGANVFYACIIRDPRDQLASLFEFDRHPELPRDERFWKKWYRQYSNFLQAAKNNKSCEFFIIRYEDLVRYPIDAKKAFLEWASFSTAGKKFSNNYQVAHENDIQDDKVQTSSGSSTTSIGRFNMVKDPGKRNLIEYYNKFYEVKNLMTEFGYLPELGKPNLKLSKNIYFFNF